MISRQEWGSATTRTPQDVVVCGDDALATSSTHYRLIVTGGDIAHCLGDPAVPQIGSSCTEVPIDAMRLSIVSSQTETTTMIAASSVVIGSWMRGRLIIVSNAGLVGRLDIAPRAHPNDGFFDVMTLQSSMGLQQRLQARKRSRLGTHIPHPLITINRSRAVDLYRSSPHETLRIDGRRVPTWTSIHIEILPDYWRLLV